MESRLIYGHVAKKSMLSNCLLLDIKYKDMLFEKYFFSYNLDLLPVNNVDMEVNTRSRLKYR